MSGAGWAALSGAGFGLFQAINARAVRDLDSIYFSTFLQLVLATVVLAIASVATEDLSELADATAWGIIAFALAGLVHFFIGWTTLNVSQARIGAARTSPLLSTSPVFGVVFAAVFASQLPDALAAFGIALTIAGAYLVADPGAGERAPLSDSIFALATACAWALSAVLTVEGLEGFSSPLLGVTVGMLASTVAYGVLLPFSSEPIRLGDRGALELKLLAGLIVGIATWGRWVALDDASVGAVLALQLLAVPVVLVAAPLISGRHVEIVTTKIWAGAALVIVGSLLLILAE
ncbi:MAG TPA: DMT family transporter [Solirubrobacterales bacterium]|nr:DMT family transporter [Solirubrobacterales bacterium]